MRFSTKGCLVSSVAIVLLGAFLYVVMGHFIVRSVLRIIGFDPIGNPDTVWTDYIVNPTSVVLYDEPPIFIKEQTPSPTPTSTRTVTRTPTETPTAAKPTSTSAPGTPEQPTAINTLLPSATPTYTLTPSPQPTAIATVTVAVVPQGGYTTWFATSNTPKSVVVHSVTSDGPVTVNSSNPQTDAFAETFLVGESTSGQQLAIAEYYESALDSLCDFWMNGCQTERYRVDRIDFRVGGMIVYGDINVGGMYWYENVGVALVLNSDRTSFEPAGVVWDDELFSLPEDGPFREQIDSLAELGNSGLDQLRMEIDGLPVTLAELRLDDERLLLILN